MTDKLGLLLTHDASIEEILPLIVGLKKQGLVEPIAMLTRPSMVCAQVKAKLAVHVDVIDLDIVESSIPDRGTGKRLRWWGTTFLNDLVTSVQSLLVFEKNAEVLIDRHNISVLGVIGDRTLGWETAFLKVAHRRRIPSILLPFAYSHPAGSLAYRLAKPDFQQNYLVNGVFKKIIGRLFRGSIYSWSGSDVFFYPLVMILAGFLSRQLPRRPWSLGGGNVTKVAVASQNQADILERYGTPGDKIIVTGLPRADLICKKQKDVGKKYVTGTVLYSVPQDAEIGILNWEDHLENVKNIATIALKYANKVVINYHPRCKRARYTEALGLKRIEESKNDIYSDISDCELVIAGPSSIVFFGLAMGKKIILTDVGEVLSSAMPVADNLVVLKDHDNLDKEMRRMLLSSKRQQEQNIINEYWLRVDGKSVDRILDAIRRMIEQ